MEYQVLEHFLSDEECDALMSMSAPRMAQSMVWDVATGQMKADDYRRSEQTFYALQENAFITMLEKRVEETTGIPSYLGEGIQVVHYRPGGYYKSHYDYFDGNFEGNRVALADGGQRTTTCMVYLNDCAEGGETKFPVMNLEFKPKKGMAVIWKNVLPDGKIDPSSFHSAEPVIAGEKWIFTKWMREVPRQEAIYKGMVDGAVAAAQQDGTFATTSTLVR